MAGAEHDLGWCVIDRVGLHGLDEAEVVDVLGDIGQEFADLDAALTVTVEIEFGPEEG